METLIVFGSPHSVGATARLLQAFTAALPAEETVTVIDCFARPPLPCRDCGGCREEIRCVQRDLDDVYAALERADRLVIATPVYNRSFSAPLKALIDRLQPYWCARFVRGVKPPIARPKQAVLLTTCDSPAARGDGAVVESQLRPALTVLNAAFAGAVHAADCGGGCHTADLAAAADLAREMCE